MSLLANRTSGEIPFDRELLSKNLDEALDRQQELHGLILANESLMASVRDYKSFHGRVRAELNRSMRSATVRIRSLEHKLSA